MSNEMMKGIVEAIAWWRLDLPDGRRALIEAAVDLLVSGDDSRSVCEMASLYPDEGSFRIDQIIERLVEELSLSPALSEGEQMIVARRMCRLVLYGELGERDLSRWVHSQFHHQSESELLNDLALLDDDYDEATEARLGSIRLRIREVATQILAGEE